MMEKSGKSRAVAIALQILAILAVALIVFFATGNVRRESMAEGKKQLEQSVRRATVACYAAEGVYPQNLDYLREHYGLQIDDGRYTVHYTAFADNLMPDITVTEKSR